jgi:hypothetical protein
MMSKILLLSLLLTSTVWAQDATEEALILNQELQFLEEAANNVTIISANQVPTQESASPIDTKSLEEKYFGNDMEDSIRTRTAAPKRRSY